MKTSGNPDKMDAVTLHLTWQEFSFIADACKVFRAILRTDWDGGNNVNMDEIIKIMDNLGHVEARIIEVKGELSK